MEIARYNENIPQSVNETKSTEYKISLADGNSYEIVKERQGYIIKQSINESDIDYIEPIQNRKYYSSYSQALKRLNLMTKEINTLYENEEGTPLLGEQKKKFILKTKKPKTQVPVAEPAPAPAAARVALPEVPAHIGLDLGDRPAQRVPMSRLRARIAERLLESQATNAILTTFNEVNMQPVMDLRNKYKDKFEKEHGVKLGFMSFFVKAAVAALKKYPILNSSVDGNDIVYHGYFDVGIAVGSPRGLVVPILRNVDQMSIADIEKKIGEFGTKAKDGKLTLEDLSGGTFSISNGGIFGSMLSTPIINPPQSAILGVHATKERAVVEDGQIVIRPMNYLALSYDHRIIDGREAVLGLVAMKEALEDPARLLLDL
jgi:2-oxoglutarate dehydrogenase E2 component (dihydrolipoamide succinyltransferase)